MDRLHRDTWYRWFKRCGLAAAAFGAAFAIGCATGGGQPHMRAALDELRAARAELETAAADKGGHRVHAIELVDDAIDQVRRGIDYAANHY
ncbi:MAG TPA: hypothetical protein VKY89_03760 [Thermoanaerobaculia bacterium]|jgi:hypothetical protein|nr:hypothetical protein [Thermoanaerobaculia bacterium]